MTRIFANDPQGAAAFYHGATRTDLFDGCFYFHVLLCVLVSLHDASSPAVRVEVKYYAIAEEHLYSV